MSTPKLEKIVQHAIDPAMEFWPRVEEAIYAVGIPRADFEWLSGYHNCHKKNCGLQHGEPALAIRMVVKAIASAVHAEMLCRATSEPDYGDDE